MPKSHIEIIRAIIDEHNHSIDTDQAREVIRTIRDNIASDNDDFTIDFDGNEYRVINEGVIWNTYVDAIKDIVEDCYDLKLSNIPDFVAFEIDWEKTAQNAYSDGYGHTFSGYDGSEVEAGGHWIFRTN